MHVEERQSAGVVRIRKHRQHLAAEEMGQHVDVHEEVGAGSDPSRAVERESAAGHCPSNAFGHLGCYGSPINTPNFDALAADGLRYNNMHATALCSPTRSCFITGRNHHSNGMSCITEGSTGYPGGNGNIPFENGMLSEILLQNGYNTYALGKWHLTPAEQISAAGPYDRWPLGRGFERYYGFIGADTHQYYPELVRDNARAASCAEGMGGQIHGQVRHRVGRLPRAGVRQAEGTGDPACEHEVVAA
jgi:arylsulfatase A-like enzyme